METPRSVNAAELSAEQLEMLEDEFGIPMPDWGTKGSVVRMMRRILEVGNGAEPGAYKRMTATAIAKLVSLDDPNP